MNCRTGAGSVFVTVTVAIVFEPSVAFTGDDRVTVKVFDILKRPSSFIGIVTVPEVEKAGMVSGSGVGGW